ncbi:selenocysteine-specific translation elongation factor [Saccharopolyspora sp. CA-218241]|uniref:selenocysteine-specific translation elongation factor n=1 Tax=Saccharopolyspora sp. CA-218241 TaxID=3240027 RepID=UPI003D99A6C1
MHVIATAGHVDHGKSTLIRALTGMEPDRWAEERRRGLTIDLGFAWTDLDAERVAFVDVPGHGRFVPNMLAGIGPVPAALLAVAADEGWQEQSTEHLDALDALGVRHGVLAVTRCDLADPADALAQARERLDGTALADVPAVPVSATTGAGLDRLRTALADLVGGLPEPDPEADPRLWVDRAFTIRGAGTVVTGTLAAGRLRVGQRLRLHPAGRDVVVRGLQALGAEAAEVTGVARVAVNLRGADLDQVRRGDALLAPGRWLDVTEFDARVPDAAALPREPVLHVGAAAVPVRVRPLGADTARLTTSSPLPLRIGDRALLRDPGAHRIAGGLVVLDVRPPALTRRGAARSRAAELAGLTGRPDAAAELRRRGLVHVDELRGMGAAPPSAGPWLLDDRRRDELAARLPDLVREHQRAHPLDDGMPAEAARRALGLPDAALFEAVARAAGLTPREGRIGSSDRLPEGVRTAVEAIRADLAEQPFQAPTADRLHALGLGERELAAAERTGALVRLAPGLVLLPDALDAAVQRLAELPEPFTLSQARQALGTSRRVAVPLLELLAARGRTKRTPDGGHCLVTG